MCVRPAGIAFNSLRLVSMSRVTALVLCACTWGCCNSSTLSELSQVLGQRDGLGRSYSAGDETGCF